MASQIQKSERVESDAESRDGALHEADIEHLQVAQYPSSQEVPTAYNQHTASNRAAETIIHFPDHTPVLPLFQFTPPQPQPSPSHVYVERLTTNSGYPSAVGDSVQDEAVGTQSQSPPKREETRPDPSANPEQKQGTNRRCSKSSSRTLLNNVFASASYRRKNLNNPVDSSQDSRLSVPTDASRTPTLKGTSVSPTGNEYRLSIHDGSKKSALYNLSPVSPTVGASPVGKQYIDPRLQRKQRKAETKTAIVLFSNERTFVHWLKFGMLLGSLAMTLLNFSSEDVRRGIDQSLADRAGRIGKFVGMGLLVICLICLAYAAFIFHWRHMGVVQHKQDGRYFDRVGPTVLTIALLATYSINVLLTIQVTSSMDANYQPSVFYNNMPPAANTTVSAVPPPPIPSPPVIDTPPLPPGSTILVNDNPEENGEGSVWHTSPSPSTPAPATDASTQSPNKDSSSIGTDDSSDPQEFSAAEKSTSNESDQGER